MKKRKELTTNGVIQLCRKIKPRPKITIKKLNKNTVLIEGSSKGLEFLGRFLIAHAHADADDCTNGLDPKGAGQAWFTRQSTLGIYVHRFPCKIGKSLAGPARKK